tara:strand:- start:5057 stop:5263 length:207 start_codon:yes stop_codon:yes gene_type:complete
MDNKDRICIGGAVYTVDPDGVVALEVDGDEWEWRPHETASGCSPYVEWLLTISLEWAQAASQQGEAQC